MHASGGTSSSGGSSGGPSRRRSSRAAGRLRRRVDYLAVQEQGRRYPGRHYLLLVRRRPPAPQSAAGPELGQGARLGITVSRKVGGAVQRNRVKRWVRESYRRLSFLAPSGVDLVVIARQGAPSSGFAATRTELETLLRKLAGK